MSAYAVFTREKTLDQGELDVYAKEAQTTVAGHEVKMLAFYGSHEDLEGAPTEGTVILRTKLPNKNQRVDCPCLATSLVNDPTLRQNSEYRKFTYGKVSKKTFSPWRDTVPQRMPP